MKTNFLFYIFTISTFVSVHSKLLHFDWVVSISSNALIGDPKEVTLF